MKSHPSKLFSAASQPIVEAMEARCLLSAAVEGGVLAIQGTDQADVISVDVTAGRIRVTMNGQRQQFQAKNVNLIEIKAGDGDDQVRLTARNRIRARVMGEAGNDLLVGGGGNDVIKGGSGDDELHGSAGNDSLAGEGGNDDLFGDAGTDSIDGGVGDDALDGGKGVDNIRGGRGSDSFSRNDKTRERKDHNKKLDAAEVITTLAQLPAPVSAAYQAAYGEMQLRKVSSETEQGVTTYMFDFTNAEGLRYKAQFLADGTFVREWPIGNHTGPAVPVDIDDPGELDDPLVPETPPDVLPDADPLEPDPIV